MTAVPRVAVSIWLRRPIMPRVGTVYWMAVVPSVPACMFSISPLRLFSRSMQFEAYSSGTEMSTLSKGSWRLPSIVCSMTEGGPISSSKPSRRIVSISTVRCSCPRPETSYTSAESVGATRRATFFSSSFSSRSLIMREVSSLPSRPPSGDLFTPKVMRTVGSSTAKGFRGIGLAGSITVSPMPIFSAPAIITISPASASVTDVRPRLSKENSSEILKFLNSPSGWPKQTVWPALREPARILPMASLPLNWS
mmetsp:Transcript_24359/g.33686  ORF Transcript_24359/g.33686 Transcript_24359/m.33686 type:complete len:252 (-) Transcript_24359:895-1650(-)